MTPISVPEWQKTAFIPAMGVATLAIAASVASAGGALPQSNGQQRIYNSTASVAFLRFSKGADVALTTDTPIAPGGVEVLGAAGADSVYVILASGTGSVYVTSGQGL